jgi:hypothetical protein
VRKKLEMQGLLEEREAPGIPEVLAGAVARMRGGGLLAELIDPPELNEPDPTLIMGPQRQRNFERFFQDSVVRDEDGEPVIVYHGTKADFDRFDNDYLESATPSIPSHLGFFFTENPRVSNHFAGADLRKVVMDQATPGGRNIPANLRLNNPYVLESQIPEGATQNWMDKRYTDAYELLYGLHLGGWPKPRPKTGEYADAEEAARNLRKQLKGQGYDGIILRNTLMDSESPNDPSDHYIIFDPKQAKSIFNDGTYDLDDDNFMSQLRRMKGLLEG